MKFSAFSSLCLVSLPLDLAYAIRLGIKGTHTSHPEHLHRRASIAGSTGLNNSADITYTTNITLGGNQFSVIIDTGSSDLYVTGDVPGSIDTGKTSGVTYAIGQVKGPVKLAKLEFAGYTIENQAYLQVPESSDNEVGTGLIGLGPNYGSQVHEAVGNATGNAVLDRIFLQNSSTPNYITILLGREDDPSDIFPGDITIGELLPGYEDVINQPKLNVSQVSASLQGNQHWQALTDPEGVIGPDGKPIDCDTKVSSTSNKKQLTAVFDSGFSLPQVPSEISRAIYEDVPGAQLVKDDSIGEIWTIPCDYEINIAFKFGGKTIPIHPLDTSLDLNATDDNGKKICLGAFQPISTAASSSFDMVLGMAFLRNTYFYLNFGDFVDGKTDQTFDPYIQLLAITNDTAENHNDFVQVRGGSKAWTADSDSVKNRIKNHLPLIIGLSAGAALLLIGGVTYCCLRNRKIRKTPAGFMSMQGSYQPLNEPAPQGYEMNPSGQQGYNNYNQPPPQQHGNYNNPWDAHY